MGKFRESWLAEGIRGPIEIRLTPPPATSQGTATLDLLATSVCAIQLQPNTVVQDGTGWDEPRPRPPEIPQKADALGPDGTGWDEPPQV